MYMTKLSFVGEDTIYVNNRKFISERVHFREMERLHKEILELKMQIEGIKEEDLLTGDDIDLDIDGLKKEESNNGQRHRDQSERE